MPSLEVGKAEYDGYLRNGLLVQLRRVGEGKDLEEAHMRNRAWISNWLIEKGKSDGSVEMTQRDGKTFIDIKDYDKMRANVGELLKEVQRITSEGDFNAAAALADNYGKKVDQALRKQVIDRAAKFNIAPMFRNDTFDVEAKDASLQMYRLARLVFTKQDAKMISETFEAVTDVGKRKEMFYGLWTNICRVS